MQGLSSGNGIEMLPHQACSKAPKLFLEIYFQGLVLDRSNLEIGVYDSYKAW